jgi:ADP-ribosyl-[dinitrogen reductase] hydrolase
MAAPGGRAAGEAGEPWSSGAAPALERDLARIAALDVHLLVTLLPAPELSQLGLETLAVLAAARGLDVRRVAVGDRSVPRDVVTFVEIVEEVLAALRGGRRVVAHCNAGIGRSGLLGAAVALRSGVCSSLEEATVLVRSVRSPQAIESPRQFGFLSDYARLMQRVPSAEHMVAGIQARRRAALLGLAVGDALGVPAEFMEPKAIVDAFGRIDKLLGGGPFRFAPGETTDDTALAVATAAAYAAEEPECDLPLAAERMMGWLASGPKDVGGQTRRAIEALQRGVEPSRAGEEASRGGASAGNGSLMRCLATGLLRLPDDPLLVDESVALSRLTHDDSRCVAACVAFNAVLSTLVHGFGGVEAGLARGAQLAAPFDEETGRLVEGVMQRRPPRILGTSIGYVLYCLERALIAARDGVDLRESLIEIVHEGGDTDTNAAVAGALLGAKLGLAALPSGWLAALVEPPGLASVPWLRALWRGEAAASGR